MPLKLPKKKMYAVPCSIWKRALAFVIDLFLINMFIVTPFKAIFASLIPEGASYSEMAAFFSANPDTTSKLVTSMIIISILAILYFTLMEHKLQQTVGKMLLGVYVVSETKELKFFQLLISNLTFIPFLPFILLWIIDPVYMLSSPKGQRLMEKIMSIQQVEYVNYG